MSQQADAEEPVDILGVKNLWKTACEREDGFLMVAAMGLDIVTGIPTDAPAIDNIAKFKWHLEETIDAIDRLFYRVTYAAVKAAWEGATLFEREEWAGSILMDNMRCWAAGVALDAANINLDGLDETDDESDSLMVMLDERFISLNLRMQSMDIMRFLAILRRTTVLHNMRYALKPEWHAMDICPWFLNGSIERMTPLDEEFLDGGIERMTPLDEEFLDGDIERMTPFDEE